MASDNEYRSVMLSIRPIDGSPPVPEDIRPGTNRDIWKASVNNALQAGAPFLSDALDDTLDSLQEHTLADIYTLMESMNISLAQRIVLTLDKEGRLDAAEHPQREAIRELLRIHPEVATGIRSMAALAVAEKSMTELCLADRLLQHVPADNADDAEAAPCEGEEARRELIFQACLQGSLSHFHLVKK